jgi:hypothetical protein
LLTGEDMGNVVASVHRRSLVRQGLLTVRPAATLNRRGRRCSCAVEESSPESSGRLTSHSTARSVCQRKSRR